MALNIGGDIVTAAPVVNLDLRYGPYDSIEKALSSIPDGVKTVGLKVGIYKDSTQKEVLEYTMYDSSKNNIPVWDLKLSYIEPLPPPPAGLQIVKNIIGSSSNSIENELSTNGNVYLNNINDNNIITSSHKIIGTGGTEVTSDSNGNMTIHSFKDKYIPEPHPDIPFGYKLLEYLELSKFLFDFDYLVSENTGVKLIITPFSIFEYSFCYLGNNIWPIIKRHRSSSYNPFGGYSSDLKEFKTEIEYTAIYTNCLNFYNDHKLKLDDEVFDITPEKFTLNNRLLGLSPSVDSSDKIRIYRMQVTENDLLVIDLIPALDLDGKYGLYDIVRLRMFYPIKGVENIAPGPEYKKHKLPDGYKEVEYINVANPNIPNDSHPKEYPKFLITYNITEHTGLLVKFLNIYPNKIDLKMFRFKMFSSTKKITCPYVKNGILVPQEYTTFPDDLLNINSKDIVITSVNYLEDLLYKGNDLISETPYKYSKSENILFMFNIETNYDLKNSDISRIYRAQITERNLIVADFIPALDNADTPVFVDIISGNVYKSITSNPGYAGPLTNPSPNQEISLQGYKYNNINNSISLNEEVIELLKILYNNLEYAAIIPKNTKSPIDWISGDNHLYTKNFLFKDISEILVYLNKSCTTEITSATYITKPSFKNSTDSGTNTIAIGNNLVTENKDLISCGRFNTKDLTPENNNYTDLNKSLFVIGNGIDDTNRKDVLRINRDGKLYINGIGNYYGKNITINTLDLASLFNRLNERFPLIPSNYIPLLYVEYGILLINGGSGVVTFINIQNIQLNKEQQNNFTPGIFAISSAQVSFKINARMNSSNINTSIINDGHNHAYLFRYNDHDTKAFFDNSALYLDLKKKSLNYLNSGEVMHDNEIINMLNHDGKKIDESTITFSTSYFYTGIGSESYKPGRKVLRIMISCENEILLDLIACVNSLNVAGLYDIVNNTFYEGQGVPFIAGPHLN